MAQRIPEPSRCRSFKCGAWIMFVSNGKGGVTPVDYNTWAAGESEFIPGKHTNHWLTCKDPDQFRRQRKEPKKEKPKPTPTQGGLFEV